MTAGERGEVAPRAPLVARRQAARARARERIAGAIRGGLTPPRRAPLSEPPAARPRWLPVAIAAGAVVASIFLHAATIGAGFVVFGWGADQAESAALPIRIEVRERPPEPPPPVEPEPEPEVEAPAPAPEPPPPAPEPPPPRPRPPRAEPPPPAPEAPPPPRRIVGLSLESTVEGGAGPAFAVGNELDGRTEERAVAPKDVQPRGEDPPAEPPRAAPANRAATRIPTAGARQVLPKRKRAVEPAYPETLRSQGIEADVTVMVEIDAEGRVTSVRIIRPAPQAEFNEAARAAALSEAFEPARRDDVAVPYTLSFTYRFRIED